MEGQREEGAATALSAKVESAGLDQSWRKTTAATVEYESTRDKTEVAMGVTEEFSAVKLSAE